MKKYFLLFTAVLLASLNAFSFFFPRKYNAFNLPFYCLLSFSGPSFISSQLIVLIAVLCKLSSASFVISLLAFFSIY